jgi:hypothetical protein
MEAEALAAQTARYEQAQHAMAVRLPLFLSGRSASIF